MFRGSGTPRQRRSLATSHGNESRKFETPLGELTACLDRMEALVLLTRKNWENQGNPLKTPDARSRPKVLSAFRSRRKTVSDLQHEASPISESVEREEKVPIARFVPMTSEQEAEMIELLRRVAELVVTGEKCAAAVMTDDEKRLQRRKDAVETGIVPAEDEVYDNRYGDLESHIALFENFFERNALALIVNIVTGAGFESSFELSTVEGGSFRTSSSHPGIGFDDDQNAASVETSETEESSAPVTPQRQKTKTILVPPLSIATQALQSVSILIQNVARATSLYFLLSNNHINDLIKLPLELYNIAESVKREESLQGEPSGPRKFASQEMQELTTHFVTFLKSLALRMNVETLQFFLTYPQERGRTFKTESVSNSPSHFAGHEEGQSSPEKQRESPSSHEVHRGTIPQKSSQRKFRPVEIESVDVQFPLYARALEFCSSHQDSFVRVTAMNICLNTLRLATLAGEEHSDSEEIMTSPDGNLDNAQALPLKERLAIAYHVCIPTRVESLVSPIFTKLAHLWGFIEEQIRDIDILMEGKSRGGGGRILSAAMEKAKAETRRKKLTNSLNAAVADMQDEFLLLEDVFQVGLSSLNEQIIEMMLATFVYPLLLQPLLLYMQRYTAYANKNGETDRFNTDILATGAIWLPTSNSDVDTASERAQEAAPAKTAFFALSGVFHFVSNPALLRLMLTALFHPLAPDSSSATMIRAKPDIACVDDYGTVTLRTDGTEIVANRGLIHKEPTPYSFGSITGYRTTQASSTEESAAFGVDGDPSCVFVLSPALTEVLEGEAGDIALIAKTRPNPYRHAILQCMSGGPDMLHLRQLSVLMFDAMISRFDSKFVSDMIFGVGMKTFGEDIPQDERHLDTRRAHMMTNRGIGGGSKLESRYSLAKGSSGANYMNEVVSALCFTVINVSTNYKGVWKLVFDGIAAHALLYTLRESAKAMEMASKLLDQRRRQSSAFISELPISIDKVVADMEDSDSEEEESAGDSNSDRRLGLHMNSMFFESVRSNHMSVVGELLRLKETVGASEEDEYSISVAMASKFDDLANRVCNFGRLPLDDNVRTAVVQVGAASAMAYVQLDAFSRFLKELAATNCNAVRRKRLAGFAISRSGDIVNTHLSSGLDVPRSIFSPVSESLCFRLLHLDDEPRDKVPPRPGSIVGLVGRTAIPCVCEVSEVYASLLAEDAAIVMSDGVKWQSLYLVFLGRHMILAEPERGGSGGNGLIVTACSLSKVAVEADRIPQVASFSPARRLLVSHFSMDDKPPGLFLPDEKRISASFGPFTRFTPFKSTLDIWFEDGNAAEHALGVMESKLKRIKSRRGNRLREQFIQDE